MIILRERFARDENHPAMLLAGYSHIPQQQRNGVQIESHQRPSSATRLAKQDRVVGVEQASAGVMMKAFDLRRRPHAPDEFGDARP